MHASSILDPLRGINLAWINQLLTLLAENKVMTNGNIITYRHIRPGQQITKPRQVWMRNKD